MIDILDEQLSLDRANRILCCSEYRQLVDRIENIEVNRIFCKHGMEHLMDVARIVWIRVLERGIGLPKDIVYGAALLHDIGRAEEYAGGRSHDEAAADIAREILPCCGYSVAETDLICEAIARHRGQGFNNGDTLGELLRSADSQSRMCFKCKASKECKWDASRRNGCILD